MATSSSARAIANGANGQAEQRVIRCAIYTRKSTEEGLQQDFNSLDAQREAAEAFIASQKREGWHLLNEHFDDAGYSSADMDRPALRRVLAAVEAGTVNCVVVYRVDRLSRSLLHFARIVETFDRNGLSFVSVTQQFNTTTSLGRLTLNILLSFAQFEREIISERTRDKMSAARRKGKWIGGHPVTADLERGFGDAPEVVSETIRLAADVGLVGCSIEDATGNPGRPLFEHALAVERIAAAAQAARSLPFPFIVTARAHNLLYGGSSLDKTINRLRAFEEAGADVLFAPACLTSPRCAQSAPRSQSRSISW